MLCDLSLLRGLWLIFDLCGFCGVCCSLCFGFGLGFRFWFSLLAVSVCGVALTWLFWCLLCLNTGVGCCGDVVWLCARVCPVGCLGCFVCLLFVWFVVPFVRG